MGSREEEHDVVIVGGGIVGLATALALHRKGIPSLVLERSDTLRATGAGIGMYTNGWHVLNQLGVGKALQMKAIHLLEFHEIWLNNSRTQVTPYRDEVLRCLKRSDLVETLAKELPVNAIRFGCQVVAIGTDPVTSFPVIHASHGSTIKAKVLIGCDGGANSIVAKSIGLKAAEPFPTYYIVAFTNYPNGHIYGRNVSRINGDQTTFGRFPINDKLIYWFVGWQVELKAGPAVDKVPEHIRDHALHLLKEFPADVIEMVERCDVDSISFNRVRFRPPWNLPFENFWKGTTIVAGDAMHMMGPYIGQGGACGMEDAVVLARCLARVPTLGQLDPDCEMDDLKKRIADAFKAYVKERRLRVMRLSAQSYLVGSMAMASSWTRKMVYIIILIIVFGSNPLSHTRYTCGHL